jgi:hypothetical protein
MSNYEGPRNGDYVAYVDKLLRANPEFRRASNSIASAVDQASAVPGSQSESPLAQVREKLRQARDAQQRIDDTGAGARARAQSAVQAQGRAGSAAHSKAEARRRFQEIEREVGSRKAQAVPKRRPWVLPFVLFMIVVGAVLTQVSPSIGAMVSLMAWFSLIGSVVARLRGK